MMNERTSAILEASVREFIKTGKPVTSEVLYEKYDFGIRPAMIRWELNELSNGGFFFQTHPSGGRFPTAKAYRTFIEKILEDEEKALSRAHKETITSFIEKFEEGAREDFIEDVSGYLSTFSGGYDLDDKERYESGLHNLFTHLDLEDKNDFVEIVEDVECLHDRVREHARWIMKEATHPRVFVGKSPFTKSQHLSVVVGKVGEKDNFVLVEVGPTRMDYERSLTFFRSLQEML